MKTSKLIFFVLTLVLVTGSFNANADCLTGSMIDSCSGGTWLGLRNDGVRIQQGQTFIVDCLSELQTVAFQLTVDYGGNNGGIPYLEAGDIVWCAIFNIEGLWIDSVDSELIHSDGTDWITFDFTIDQTILEIGEYFVAMKTFEDKMAGVVFNSTDHGPGYKMTQCDSGEWEHNPTSDLNHEIVMTQDFVANKDFSWGEIKSMFR